MHDERYDKFRSLVDGIPQVAGELVRIETSLRDDGVVEVQSIWSEVERGKGHASAALRGVVAAADECGLAMTGSPHWLAYDTEGRFRSGETEEECDRLDALNDRILDNDQLEAWYARLGFLRTGEFEGDDPVLWREPLAPVPTPGR